MPPAKTDPNPDAGNGGELGQVEAAGLTADEIAAAAAGAPPAAAGEIEGRVKALEDQLALWEAWWQREGGKLSELVGHFGQKTLKPPPPPALQRRVGGV